MCGKVNMYESLRLKLPNREVLSPPPPCLRQGGVVWSEASSVDQAKPPSASASQIWD